MFAALSGLGVRAAAQPAATETQVKAAFRYNFAQFATWPPAAAASGPFRVCAAGDDRMGTALAEMLRNESVAGRPVTLVRDPDPEAWRTCHLLFIGAATPAVDAMLRRVDGAPVLTVGEDEGFLRRGGTLAFAPEGGRIRFDVNLAAADAAGIRLSSRLLQVARRVER